MSGNEGAPAESGQAHAESLAGKLQAFAVGLPANERAILGTLLEQAAKRGDTNGFVLGGSGLFAVGKILGPQANPSASGLAAHHTAAPSNTLATGSGRPLPVQPRLPGSGAFRV